MNSSKVPVLVSISCMPMDTPFHCMLASKLPEVVAVDGCSHASPGDFLCIGGQRKTVSLDPSPSRRPVSKPAQAAACARRSNAQASAPSLTILAGRALRWAAQLATMAQASQEAVAELLKQPLNLENKGSIPILAVILNFQSTQLGKSWSIPGRHAGPAARAGERPHCCVAYHDAPARERSGAARGFRHQRSSRQRVKRTFNEAHILALSCRRYAIPLQHASRARCSSAWTSMPCPARPSAPRWKCLAANCSAHSPPARSGLHPDTGNLARDPRAQPRAWRGRAQTAWSSPRRTIRPRTEASSTTRPTAAHGFGRYRLDRAARQRPARARQQGSKAPCPMRSLAAAMTCEDEFAAPIFADLGSGDRHAVDPGGKVRSAIDPLGGRGGGLLEAIARALRLAIEVVNPRWIRPSLHDPRP